MTRLSAAEIDALIPGGPVVDLLEPPDDFLPDDAPQRLTPRPTTTTTYTVGQLAELPSADEEYVIGDGILTRGGKLLIHALPGAGKTTLLDFVAGSLASGKPFLGRFAIDRPRRVLVVQGELSLPEMSSHAQQLVAAGLDTDNLVFARMTDLKLPAGEQTLRDLIAATGADVLALDPWYRLFAGESSDKPEQVGTIFDVCDRLLDGGLIEAAIVVHHSNVTGIRTAGSWLFEGWPSTIIKLERRAGVRDQRTLTFSKVRAPSSTIEGTSLVVALGEAGYFPVELDVPRSSAGTDLAVLVVKDAGGQLHRGELLARLMVRAQCKQRAASKYLGTAVQARRLKTIRDGQRVLYVLDVADEGEAA